MRWVAKISYEKFMKKPIFRKTVLLTRDAKANRTLVSNLKKCDVRALSLPSFEYKALPLTDSKKNILKSFSNFDWIVFTSVHGVEFFFRALSLLNIKTDFFSGVKIAAVGEVTARFLKDYGYAVNIVPQKKSAAGLSEVFKKIPCARILLVRPVDGNLDFETKLKKNHRIKKITLYKKTAIKYSKSKIQKILQMRIDEVWFYSPSAVKIFIKYFKTRSQAVAWLSKVKVCVIGETTRKSLPESILSAQLKEI